MNPASLVDPASILVVLGGTLLATVLRAGPKGAGVALGAVLALPQRRFDAGAIKARLAGQVREICSDGLLRAAATPVGDRAIDEANATLVRTRSLDEFHAVLERHHGAREARGQRAVAALGTAAESASAFGLVGTLLALAQMGAGQMEQGLETTLAAAVLTTLYGVLLAHLVFAPLAEAVERALKAEEKARADVGEWMADQVARVLPAKGWQDRRAA